MNRGMKYGMEEFISLSKALSDTHRVRALFALRDGELCVCQIIELLGLAPSTVSKHMSVLKQAGLVECRKEECWMYYRLPKESDMPMMVRSMFMWAFGALDDEGTIVSDQTTMKPIREHDLIKLCKNQRSK